MCGKVFSEQEINDSIGRSDVGGDFPRCESPEAGTKPFVDSGIGGHLFRELRELRVVENKYGTITSTTKEFHQGEPVFLLRATDPLAPQAIRNYAYGCEINGCSKEHVEACLGHALRTEQWQHANLDKVKNRPD
jgi:hypothetical protein